MAPVRGFTLIEMLVALGVFAVLGAMSSQLLTRMIDVHNVAVARGERLGDVQRALGVIQRDIMQLAYRSVRDELGDVQMALKVTGEGAVELTRGGWRNPLGLRRSELERVAYSVDEDGLTRYSWAILDRANDTEPLRQELLGEVTRFEVLVLDAGGNEHAFWPPLGGGSSSDPEGRIAGVMVRLEAPPYGELLRMWEAPAEVVVEAPLEQGGAGAPG